MLIDCALTGRPVRFVRAGRVLDIMRIVTNGWALESAGAEESAPVIAITGGWRGYTITEAGKRDILERTAVSAACTAIMILLNRMIETRADYLCLHAAAARSGDETIVFPSTHRAGKSTLVSALAFDGWRVVAEDILPIDCSGDRARGVAAGVAPRLRRPVARALGKGFRRDVMRHGGPRDRWLRYIGLPPDRIDMHGRTAPIGAFVFLDRQDGASELPPTLSPVTRGSAMETILRQNFGTTAPPTEIVDRVAAMADDAACFRLSYHHLDDARRLLDSAFGEAFGTGEFDGAHSAVTPSVAPASATEAPRIPAMPDGSPGIDPHARLRARTDISLREEDGIAFLMDETKGAIFSLDALGLGIWGLMETAQTLEELTQAVAQAHPDVAPTRIEADIARLLATLVEAGLVEECGAPPRAAR